MLLGLQGLNFILYNQIVSITRIRITKKVFHSFGGNPPESCNFSCAGFSSLPEEPFFKVPSSEALPLSATHN